MTLSAEKAQAVEKIFTDRGIRHGNLEVEIEWAQHHAGWGRSAKALGAEIAEDRYTLAEQILKAAGLDAVIAPDHTSAPRSRASAASVGAQGEGDDVLLGLDAQGHALTVDGCQADGVDPLAYLTAPGAVLSAVGKGVLRHLQEAPTARAAELKLDVEGIKEWCAKNGKDFDVSLRAAVECEEERLRLQAIMDTGIFGDSRAREAVKATISPADQNARDLAIMKQLLM